tara:strand:+ start:489 stop:635 length:147 start_codon:yes stop_codon:yes gene_type:complete
MLKNKIQNSFNNLTKNKRLKKLKVDSAEKIYNFFYYWHKISSKKNLFD